MKQTWAKAARLTASHDRDNFIEALREMPMVVDDGLIGEKHTPSKIAAVIGGIPVYSKPELLPGHVELRDRYGIVIGVIRGVASISMVGDSKK